MNHTADAIETARRINFERRFIQAAATWLQIQDLIENGQSSPAFSGGNPYLVTLGDCDWRAELAIQCRNESQRRKAENGG